ncbi:hypothetical protein DENSPDRAFT_618514 [Dentipellis sp. KUC8613]|nr:hypothetical protein DENSPDRAFT_618514 [Dentipellis sp. KUC8613]
MSERECGDMVLYKRGPPPSHSLQGWTFSPGVTSSIFDLLFCFTFVPQPPTAPQTCSSHPPSAPFSRPSCWPSRHRRPSMPSLLGRVTQASCFLAQRPSQYIRSPMPSFS